MSTKIIPTKNKALPVAAIAISALGITASSANAETLQLGNGATTVKLYKSTGAALSSLGVKVSPSGSAVAGSRGVKFPVTGGSVDSATAAGVISHSGGLTFSKGDKKLALKNFKIVVKSERATISSIVNGSSRVVTFNLDLTKAKLASYGSGAKLTGVRLKLSEAAAKALNATFKVKAFKTNMAIGKAGSMLVPRELEVKSGVTRLALDPATASALTGLGLTVAPVAPAASTDAGIEFAVTGKGIDTKTLAGMFTHTGGLKISNTSKAVELTDFTIDTEKGTLSALVGGSRAEIATVDLSNATVAVSGKRVKASGAKVTLNETGATALNQAFSTTALSSNTVLGTATVIGLTSN